MHTQLYKYITVHKVCLILECKGKSIKVNVLSVNGRVCGASGNGFLPWFYIRLCLGRGEKLNQKYLPSTCLPAAAVAAAVKAAFANGEVESVDEPNCGKLAADT